MSKRESIGVLLSYAVRPCGEGEKQVCVIPSKEKEEAGVMRFA